MYPQLDIEQCTIRASKSKRGRGIYDDDHLDGPLPILDSFEPRALEPACLQPTEWRQPITRNNLLCFISASPTKSCNH